MKTIFNKFTGIFHTSVQFLVERVIEVTINTVYAKLFIEVSQKDCARIREGVPYSKVYRYNPNHVCPKLNCYGDNGL
jgi:hypothetical protein